MRGSKSTHDDPYDGVVAGRGHGPARAHADARHSVRELGCWLRREVRVVGAAGYCSTCEVRTRLQTRETALPLDLVYDSESDLSESCTY